MEIMVFAISNACILFRPCFKKKTMYCVYNRSLFLMRRYELICLMEKVVNFIMQIMVMTPQILLDALRHGFMPLRVVHLLIFDECHRANGSHPYANIMKVGKCSHES